MRLVDVLMSVKAFAMDYYAPPPTRDAVVVLTLPPGGYSAVLSSAIAGASGLALIEIYEVP